MRVRKIPWRHRFVTLGAVLGGTFGLTSGHYGFVVVALVLWIGTRGMERYLRFGPEDILFLRAFGSEQVNRKYYWQLEPVLECFARTLTVESKHTFRQHPLDIAIKAITFTPGRVGTIQLDENWKLDITDAIAKARLVVVDISTMTENVLWELNSAVELAGKERVVLVTTSTELVVELPPGVCDLAQLSYSSPTFQHDAAMLLDQRLGRPSPFRRQALALLLASQVGIRYYVLQFLAVLSEVYAKGIGYRN